MPGIPGRFQKKQPAWHAQPIPLEHYIASTGAGSTPRVNEAAPDVTNYVNQHLTYGVQLTTDQVAQELASGQIESDAVYSSKSSEVYLSTDYTVPLHATDLKDLPGTVHQPIDRIEEDNALKHCYTSPGNKSFFICSFFTCIFLSMCSYALTMSREPDK